MNTHTFPVILHSWLLFFLKYTYIYRHLAKEKQYINISPESQIALSQLKKVKTRQLQAPPSQNLVSSFVRPEKDTREKEGELESKQTPDCNCLYNCILDNSANKVADPLRCLSSPRGWQWVLTVSGRDSTQILFACGPSDNSGCLPLTTHRYLEKKFLKNPSDAYEI